MRFLSFCVAGLLLLGAACSDDEEPTPDPTPTVSVSPEETPTPDTTPSETGVTDCDNETEALSGEANGSLIGDVDGDGNEDTVSVFVDESGDQGCQAFITIETGSGEGVAPIVQEGTTFEVGFPALAMLAEIDGEPGLDIVVNLIAGASTQFAGVYTAHDGFPERLTFDVPTEFGDLFPTGGSVGHLEASDCVGPGAITITTAVPQGDRYKVTRSAYVVVDGKLTPQEEGQSIEKVPLDDALDRFPEFQASPFGSCPAG